MIVVSAWHETRRSLLTIFVYPSPDCRPVYTQFSGCCGYTDLPFKAVACRFDLLFGWILTFSRHDDAPPIRTMTFVFSLSLIGGAYQRPPQRFCFYFFLVFASSRWVLFHSRFSINVSTATTGRAIRRSRRPRKCQAMKPARMQSPMKNRWAPIIRSAAATGSINT